MTAYSPLVLDQLKYERFIADPEGFMSHDNFWWGISLRGLEGGYRYWESKWWYYYLRYNPNYVAEESIKKRANPFTEEDLKYLRTLGIRKTPTDSFLTDTKNKGYIVA